MSLAVFEPAVAASEQPKTKALHRVAAGIGILLLYCKKFSISAA